MPIYAYMHTTSCPLHQLSITSAAHYNRIYSNTDLGEVVVGGPAAAAEPPGDLAAEDEEGVHVSLPLDAHHAALPHRVAPLPEDGRQLVRGLHQSEVSAGVT